MSLPRYPEYKDSGVEWLGKLPAHWRTDRIKRACDVYPSNIDKKTYEGESPVQLCNYTDVYYNELITGELPFMFASASKEQIRKFTLRAGDTIITKDSETADDIAIAAYVPEDLPGVVCGYHLAMVRPRKSVEGRYVKRLFDSHYLKSCFAVLANGLTRVGLSQNALANVVIPIPPVVEQTAIAAFLDREIGKIDALIAEQEKLITLLAEKRHATISHAVKRGLNPSAPIKRSGAPWLEDVPAHWDVEPLANRYRVQLGKMLDSAKISGEHLRPYLRVFDVQWGEINAIELPKMDFDEEAREKFRLVIGDILVNEGGSYPGRSAIWKGEIEECYYQKALHRLRPVRQDKDFSEFFYFVLFWAANQGVFVAGGNETTIEHLPAERLRRYRFAFPPLNEQCEIAAFLHAETAKLETLKAEAVRATLLLKERRSALIAAAVTGQIDVRGAVARPAATMEAMAA